MTRLRLRVSGDPWLYAVARVLLVAAVRLYGRVRVSGAENLPARGGAIVVSNHPSDVDPVLLGVAAPRTLHFLADVVQFRRAFVGPVIARLAALPIDKGRPDRHALQQALDLLARGEVVALFPEGDLYRRREMAAFARGVAFLAARSGAPVVPVGISGAERLWDGWRLRRPRIEVRIGRPLRLERPAPRAAGDYERMTEQVREAVRRLLEGEAPSRPLRCVDRGRHERHAA